MNQTEQLLTQLDEKIVKLTGEQKRDFEERLKTLTKEHGDVLGRLKLIDEGIETRDEYLKKLEGKIKEQRFNAGGGRVAETDALRNALPEDCRDWPQRISMMRGGEFIGTGGMLDGAPMMRTFAAARLAQTDPVLCAAAAAWMRCRIKASLATKAGKPERAAKWNEQGDKLAEAMGGFTTEARAALQEDTDSEGGYLVPTILEAMIGWLMKDHSVVRAAGPTVIQMTSKIHQLPNLANDFTYTWFTEEGTFTDAAPSAPFAAGNLSAKKGGGLVTLSIELIQDNPNNLVDFLLVHLLAIRGRAEDIQMLEGDGTIFTGLFSASGVASVAGGSAAMDPIKFAKLVYGAEHQTTVGPGVAFMHPWCVRDLLVATNAQNPWGLMTTNLASQGLAPDTIANKRVFTTSAISRTRGGGNESTAYHGNPAYLIVGDRMGTEFVINPWSESHFKAGQVLARLMNRTGYLVWVPGFFTKLTAITTAA
jgi:HK97 family phage major capsid protein